MTTDQDHGEHFSPDFDLSQIQSNPILDHAAHFWEKDRYQAFRICYRSMRRIDDLVDDRRAMDEAIGPRESGQLKTVISNWIESVRRRAVTDECQEQLVQTIDRFRIPLWPWERFARAMVYDVDHNGYSSLLGFLRYAEGAAISPAAVFVHLCGLSSEAARYRPPAYDLREAARPLALFAYLVHIVRDFKKDQQSGLNYFAT
jgi:phytoene/squalene synthetase